MSDDKYEEDDPYEEAEGCIVFGEILGLVLLLGLVFWLLRLGACHC